jgi:hypothetical protein
VSGSCFLHAACFNLARVHWSLSRVACGVIADWVGNSIEGDVSSKDGCAAIAQSVAKHESKASGRGHDSISPGVSRGRNKQSGKRR